MDASFRPTGSLSPTYPALTSPHQLVPSRPPLPHSLSFLLRVPQAGSHRPPQTPLWSGVAAITPGTALGPGGCHPRGRPGLSRAPASTSQSPKSHWEVWVGKVRNEGGGSERQTFAWQLKLVGMRRQSEGPPFMEQSSCDSLLPEGLENSVPNSALSEGRGGSDLNRTSPEDSSFG